MRLSLNNAQTTRFSVTKKQLAESRKSEAAPTQTRLFRCDEFHLAPLGMSWIRLIYSTASYV
jgi:hypothetical protein